MKRLGPMALFLLFLWPYRIGFSEPGDAGLSLVPAHLHARIWRVTLPESAPALDWQAFLDSSQSTIPASTTEPETRRSASIERVYRLLNPDEADRLPIPEQNRRAELFQNILSQSLNRPIQAATGENVLVLNESPLNQVKARILYASLLAPPGEGRSTLPSSPGGPGWVFYVMRVDRRVPSQMADLLNRVAGRKRETRVDQADDLPVLPMRIIADNASHQIIIAAPAGGASSPEPVPASTQPGRLEEASFLRARHQDQPWLLHASSLNFASLRLALKKQGEVKFLFERRYALLPLRPISLAAGEEIPLLASRHAWPGESEISEWHLEGASIDAFADQTEQGQWQAVLLAETVDLADYPNLSVHFRQLEGISLKMGDTMICKNLVENEMEPIIQSETNSVRQAATIVMLTLEP